METACASVVFVGEFSAGVEGGEDDFESGDLGLGVLIDGDAPAVVGDSEGGTVLMELEEDLIAVSGEVFVN